MNRAQLRSFTHDAAAALGNVGAAEHSAALTCALENPEPGVGHLSAWASTRRGRSRASRDEADRTSPGTLV